ncbi:MAG: GTPase Era [Burkholderiales bacterium]|nr:GTPase Era [Burkholderiales bacterium]
MEPAADHGATGARTGRVAIIGRPNVGKSTLLNALVGEHVSITSRKSQTTRVRVLGVLTRGTPPATTQCIFVDTPGYQRRHRSVLNRRMNEAVGAALADADVVVLVIDARGFSGEDQAVLDLLPAQRPGVILAINKTDQLADRDQLLPRIAAVAARYPFAAVVPVSAEKRHQLDELLDEIERRLPAGEPLFEADQFTDRSVRFLAAESIREKAFRLLGDELPYGIAVTIERWQEDERRAEIVATLLVERDAHKAIVIGAGGAKLREIGRLARLDIERLLGKPVHLQTHVRVRRGWNDDARLLSSLGYE